MVCVECGPNGQRTAQDFGRRFQLPPSVINGYIEQKAELPGYGQLGCQGFIVLGPYGEFAVTRTVPCYLEAGAKAFDVVEKLLAREWDIRAQSASAGVPQQAACERMEGTCSSCSAPPSAREEREEEPRGYAKLSALMVGAIAVRGTFIRKARGDDAARSFGEVFHWHRALSDYRVLASRDLTASPPARWSLRAEAGIGGLCTMGSLRASLQRIVRKALRS